MAKRVIETFDCDKCGREGQRYELTYPNGDTRIIDRCETHAKPLERLANEPGEWKQEANIKRYHKSDVDSIMKAVRTAKN